MAGNIKGIIVEIGGDTSGLQNALKKVNSATASLSKELKGINSLLKLDPKNTELLKQKQDILNKSMEETRNKLTSLKEAQVEYDKRIAEGTKINEENYRFLQREILKTEQQLGKLELQGDAFYKMGEGAKEFGNKLTDVGTKIDSLGNKLTTSLTLPVAGLLTVGIKYNAELEQMTTAYFTFLGSAEEADKVIQNIKENAKKTPFDVTSLARANQMLISTGENADDAQKTIMALGEAITATGGGNDELTRMASNLQQIRNAGKATSMDIRQFAYAGIDVYGLLADYTGKTTKEVKDMEISYEELAGALQKASKEGGKYYGAMEKSSETLAGQTKQLKAQFKDMTGELAKSLMPVAKDLIKNINELIKRFNGLSDSQKQNIVRIGLLVAGIGPFLKIAGTLTKVVGTTSKAFGTFSQAIGVVANNTKSSDEAVNSLAKGLKGVVSPAGLATVGVTAFVAAVALVKAKVDAEYASLSQLNEELKNNTEIRKEALKSIEEQRTASLNEIGSVQSLKAELSGLVDENGKVNEGYELRAKFILGELNKALGTEYSMTGNIVDNYKEMSSAIDDLIQKKKAQIILESNEAEYAEAMKEKDNVYKDHIKTQDELISKTKRLTELQEESRKGFVGSKQSLVENSLEGQKLSKEIINLTNNYKEQEQTLNRYQTAIERYNKNSVLMLEGTAESYKEIERSIATSQANITSTTESNLSERLNAQIEANIQMKREYDLEAKYNQDVKNSIYADNVKSGQENLKLLTDELISRTNTVGDLGQDEIDAWKTLGQKSSKEYDTALSEMPISMKNKIIAMTGIATSDTSVEEATKSLAQEANTGFNDNVDGSQWGKDLVSLIAKGMVSTIAKNSIISSSKSVAGWISSYLHFSVPDVGPLSDMDKSMPDMIDLMIKGLDENKSKLLNKVQLLSREFKNSLNMSGNILGDSSLKTNTVFTTPNIVFNVQKMDEANLNTAFNYVNRRLGSQY